MIDRDWRMLILEGLVAGGMGKLASRVARACPNSATAKYLFNPEVQFPYRLFTAFNACPKDIRLRDPLADIMRSPGLYDRARCVDLVQFCWSSATFIVPWGT